MLRRTVSLAGAIVCMVLVIVLGAVNFTLQDKVNGLANTLSQALATQDRLRVKNEELSRQLAERLTEIDLVTARSAPLERLVVNQTAKITMLANQIHVLQSELEVQTTDNGVGEFVLPVTVINEENSLSQPDARDGITHVLKRGETLRQLAREYYNAHTAWRRILDANRAVVKNTRSMLPGIVLFIPKPD